jgi:hypothetical protein
VTLIVRLRNTLLVYRRLSYFLIAVALLIAINHATKVTMNYHWIQSDEAISRLRAGGDLPSAPSMLVQQIGEWALTAQPWWGFAGLNDPWASPPEGRWPIRAWIGTISFQIVGSLVSAVIYFTVLSALGRAWTHFRNRSNHPAESGRREI